MRTPPAISPATETRPGRVPIPATTFAATKLPVVAAVIVGSVGLLRTAANVSPIKLGTEDDAMARHRAPVGAKCLPREGRGVRCCCVSETRPHEADVEAHERWGPRQVGAPGK